MRFVVSVFCFKMLNFKYSPKTLNDEICGNLLELSNFQFNPSFVPENIKRLRNRTVNNFESDIITKYKIKTFSYFSNIFLNCFDLNIFNYTFKNCLIFYNQYSNVIYTSITNTFAYFNLEQKSYNWIKALS